MNWLGQQLPDLSDRSQDAGTPAVALLCLSFVCLVYRACLSACRV